MPRCGVSALHDEGKSRGRGERDCAREAEDQGARAGSRRAPRARGSAVGRRRLRTRPRRGRAPRARRGSARARRARGALAGAGVDEPDAPAVDAFVELGLASVVEPRLEPARPLAARAVARRTAHDEHAGDPAAQQELDHRGVQVARAGNWVEAPGSARVTPCVAGDHEHVARARLATGRRAPARAASRPVCSGGPTAIGAHEPAQIPHDTQRAGSTYAARATRPCGKGRISIASKGQSSAHCSQSVQSSGSTSRARRAGRRAAASTTGRCEDEAPTASSGEPRGPRRERARERKPERVEEIERDALDAESGSARGASGAGHAIESPSASALVASASPRGGSSRGRASFATCEEERAPPFRRHGDVGEEIQEEERARELPARR